MTEPVYNAPPYPLLLDAAAFSAGTGGKIAASDPRLGSLLTGATTAVRRYCGWHVAPIVREAITLDGDGGTLLALRTLRLMDVTSVVEDGVMLDSSAYEWSANGEIRRHGRWTRQWRAIVVDATHGFGSADDLVQVVQQVVANAIASPLGATREQAGQVSISWATTAPGVSGGLSLLDRDYAVLDRYRLPGSA